MSTTQNKLENKNTSRDATTVLDALRINDTQKGVICAIADNLGEDVLTFLATAIRDHVEGLLQCPEACGLAFSERMLATWKAAEPEA